ncbi:MAG: hypothetical protein IJF83_03360 [Methanobrevibacter sp.]|nr:hypothetical protein [Methanobrevibacter sp.]
MREDGKWVTIEYPCYHCRAWHIDFKERENYYVCRMDGHKSSSKEGLSMSCPDKEKYEFYKKLNEDNMRKLENMG